MVLEQFTVSLNIVFLSNIFFLLLATFSLNGFLSLRKIYFFINDISPNLLVLRCAIFLSYIFIFYSCLNFIIPLSDKIILIFYAIGLMVFLIKLIKKDLIIGLKWQFIIALFIILYLLNSGYNNDFDYHSHHIDLYKNYRLFEFKNNILDGRIYYNSAYLILNSATFLSFINISIKFLSAYVFALFIWDVREYLKIDSSNFIVSKILPIFFLISVFLTISKFKNIGTDYIAHIIYLSLILFYLFIYNNYKEYFFSKNFPKIIFIILAILIVLKISMVLCCLICVHFFFLKYKNKSLKNIFSIYIFVPILVVFIWIYQNYFLSSCIVYPIKSLCFLDDKSLIIFENNMISLFAKSVKVNYWDESLVSLQSMNSFPFWIQSWFNDHFFKILEKFIPCLIIANLIFYKFLKKGKFTQDNQLIEFQNILFITWLFTLIIWFVEAPAIRFGFSYITINLFMLNYLALKALNLNFIQHKKSNYLMKIFYLLIFMMIIYQFFRIITQ